MVFIHCTNCGHDKHGTKCGNTHNHIAIGCMCNDYQEGRIDDIRKLTEIIQSVNKQNIEYNEKQIDGKNIDMQKWIMIYLKLYALQDRFHKHFGIMNYSTPDPI